MGAVAGITMVITPEVKGSVPGAGPPTLQAGSPGATLLPLRRPLFTSCHFKVAKWIKQTINLNKYEKSAIISPVTSVLGRKLLENVWPKDYAYSGPITDEKHLKFYLIAVTQCFINMGGFIVIIFYSLCKICVRFWQLPLHFQTSKTEEKM